MVGILIVSHGKLSEGFRDTISMFFNNEEQIDTMSVFCDTNLDYFREEMSSKLEQLDTGDGVIILADIFGGSPCNTTYYFLKRNVDIIAGVNLPIILAAITARKNTIDRKEIVDCLLREAQSSIINVKEKFEEVI